jgi:hypothetical protein
MCRYFKLYVIRSLVYPYLRSLSYNNEYISADKINVGIKLLERKNINKIKKKCMKLAKRNYPLIKIH